MALENAQASFMLHDDFKTEKKVPDRLFELSFKGVSTRFGLRLLENVQKTVRNVFCFRNVATHTFAGRLDELVYATPAPTSGSIFHRPTK